MKLRSQVSAEKLRGGFYTPAGLVRHAVERVRELGGGGAVLEPSCGDGAFLRGLAGLEVSRVCAVETVAAEAASARAVLARAGLSGTVVDGSTLAWSLAERGSYDVVVGNLPFVRFQFISPRDRADALRHAAELGVSLGGVANLWLPMLLAALRRLRAGGCYSLVLPAECFTGVSAGSGREWLLRESAELRCDLFPAGSYPGVLQEVVVISGRRVPGQHGDSRPVRFVQQLADRSEVAQTHSVPVGPASWTPYLLPVRCREAAAEFASLDAVRRLGSVARLGVAAVTGANAYFSLTRADVEAYELGRWARPLLPRTKGSPGLVFTRADLEGLAESGAAAYLFDAGRADADPREYPGPRGYLEAGERDGIDRRYKCRIRSPWYAVPHIKHGRLLMSKRSHRFPRLILNATDAVTTDTIYCGDVLGGGTDPAALVAGFLNSGTLLAAELEGRMFGGGVLELVPSEVGRLSVPLVPELAAELPRLDALSREDAPTSESVVRETDLLLVKADVGVTPSLVDRLAEARSVLLARRLARSAVPRDHTRTHWPT